METIAEALQREGREAGIALGMERGMERGMEKRTFDIAKNMLVDNFDIEVIQKITGLSVEQIQALQQ